jgi:hypothetical protein
MLISHSVAYAEIIFDGRLSKNDFSGYRALEADGRVFTGASASNGVQARLERVFDPGGSGELVMRATHLQGDVPTNGGYRSELNTFKDPLGIDRWYSWGYYLPDVIKGVKNGFAIAQIHDTADVDESDMRNPSLAVMVESGRVKLLNAFDHDRITSPRGVVPTAGIDYERRELASWELDTSEWTFLDLHVKWAGDDTGFLEFWKDGVLLFQEKGHINTFNDEGGVWFKTGLYDWSHRPAPITVYSTGVVIGDGRESLQSMSMLLVPEPRLYFMTMLGLLVISFFAYRKRYTDKREIKS